MIVEAGSEIGGRVGSVVTDDGYVLDRGFAVFVEEYPSARALLDYDALDLRRFDPGAMVCVKRGGEFRLARVTDPIRRPAEIMTAIMSEVGSVLDKAALIPLLFTVRTKSIDQLFGESVPLP